MGAIPTLPTERLLLLEHEPANSVLRREVKDILSGKKALLACGKTQQSMPLE